MQQPGAGLTFGHGLGCSPDLGPSVRYRIAFDYTEARRFQSRRALGEVGSRTFLYHFTWEENRMLEVLIDLTGLAAAKKYPAVRRGARLFWMVLLLVLAAYVGYAFLAP